MVYELALIPNLLRLGIEDIRDNGAHVQAQALEHEIEIDVNIGQLPGQLGPELRRVLPVTTDAVADAIQLLEDVGRLAQLSCNGHHPFGQRPGIERMVEAVRGFTTLSICQTERFQVHTSLS